MKLSDTEYRSFTGIDEFFLWFDDHQAHDVSRFLINTLDCLPLSGMLKIEEDSNQLVVFFNGAVNREKYTFEAYQRWSWMVKLPYNVLILADGTLSEGEFSLGWGVGRPDSWFIETAGSFLQDFMKKSGFEESQTILYGSSAGGFQAFQCAIQMKECTVIMENPQTNVFRYYDHHVSPLLNSIHFGPDEDQIMAEYGIRFDLLESAKHSEFVPRTLYVQNINDSFHYKNHLKPFQTGIDEMKYGLDRIEYDLYEGENTHSPQGFSFLDSLLKRTYSFINEP